MQITTRILTFLVATVLATGSAIAALEIAIKKSALAAGQAENFTEQCPPLLAQPNQQGDIHNYHCSSATLHNENSAFNHTPFLPEIFYGNSMSAFPFQMRIQPEKVWLWQQALEAQQEREARARDQHRQKRASQPVVKETREGTVYGLP